MQHQLFDSNIPKYTASTVCQSRLLIRDSAGAVVPATDMQILAAARDVANQLLPTRQALNTPAAVKEFFTIKMNRSLEHEVFGMVLLDATYGLIDYQEPFRGTLMQAAVYPREVVKISLKANAAAIIIAHNHPSGRLEPSQADRQLTQQLRQALALVDIRLLDHILVAGNATMSFAETGLL